jgi:LmbE family N-acetylglucosaminyl deacetylase
LNWLCDCASRDRAPVVVLIAAHPDDEIVGAGARLCAIRRAHVIHVTDGAPRDMRDGARLGFASFREYAEARRAEACRALGMAAIGEMAITALGFADQETTLNLADVTRKLAQRLQSIGPDVILTHAYEGGHPDHDASAFAVHAAARGLWGKADGGAPAIIEFASYHALGERVAFLEFLPHPNEVKTMVLTEHQRELKRQMIAAHATQAATLRSFPLDCERFRLTPEYDFTMPPHRGPLYYERHDWGMRGGRFRRLAAAALDELGLASPI